ncbi:methyltransferase domain-containing protein [Streptantibioticus silvisoli]|uniref:Protein-L-isoaspartate O-methyltransferase n=1 Tax=Streptantibioticus silvisoli TaxID=2705255 RepID=A0ABT6W946_9ACTN|nr:methyltransferase domain-containing protein [Streptantibioticus silvisoli]MDI5967286.1 methyltransferase domain-containing protein [Streptantibioticus silvisoli]
MDADRWADAARAPRARLVRRLTDAGHLADDRWRAAFEQVPRHLFVPAFHRPVPGGGWDRLSGADRDPRRAARWLSGVYEDAPLATRVRDGVMTSSSSQPSLMAAMLDALGVRDGDRVLEVGAGTGWNAALLAHRLTPDAVTSVDLDADVTAAAREHLAAAGVPTGPAGIAVVTGDGARGDLGRAPYDRVVVTCELSRVPEELLRQCAPGGLLLAPLAGGLIALRVTGPGRAQGRFLSTPAYFVALRTPGEPVARAGRAAGAGRRTRDSRIPSRVLDDDVFRFVLTLVAGELTVDRGFGVRTAVLTAPDGSTAVAGPDGGVRLTGERDLWAVVEREYGAWRAAGHPDRERFGLSVDGARQWAWLDTPDGPGRWELSGRR